MRVKTIPPLPAAGDPLRTVRDAAPRTPRPEDSCCDRLVERVEWIDRTDDAREWLSFLDALGLVTETGGSYARTGGPIEDAPTAARFRERVFLVEEVLEAVSDRPRLVAAAFDDVADAIPPWERRRHTDWRDEWRARVSALLAWADHLGLAEATENGYVATDDDSRD